MSSFKLAPDRLRNAGPGEPVEVWIDSAFEKDHWIARRPGDLTHAMHPGTAVQIFDVLYEIITAQGTVEEGYVIRYGLKTWDRSQAVRHTIQYNPVTQAHAADAHLEEAHRQALRRRIARFFFLAGMAPDPLQRKWEAETGLSMTVISAASTVTNFFIFLTLIQIYGQAPPVRAEWVIEYIIFDSMIRILWIVFSGQPHGTVILSLPYLLWEAVARPDQRAKKKVGLKFSHEEDEAIRRPGTGNLTIRSVFFDDLLMGPTPIRFEGTVYKPLHWHEEGKGLVRRWIYEFGQIDPEPNQKLREYTRPRTPERQMVVEDFTRRRDKVHILAMIWSTYPRDEQFRLQAKYQFPAAQWTAVTAGFLLAGAVLQGWAMFILGGTVFFYICPVYMFLESVYRLYQSKGQGQPAASVLGLLLSLFLRAPQ